MSSAVFPSRAVMPQILEPRHAARRRQSFPSQRSPRAHRPSLDRCPRRRGTIRMTELIWEGKYDAQGRKVAAPWGSPGSQ
jgi:hypothetical protein